MRYIKNWVDLVFYSSSIKDDTELVWNKDWESYEQVIQREIKEDSGNLMFVIGEWGAGKSSFISLLQNSRGTFKDKRVDRLSLHWATDLNEAYLLSIPMYIKAICLSLLLVILYFLADDIDILISKIENSKSLVALSILIGLWIFVNKYRFGYVFLSLIDCLIGIFLPKVKILEDFDRSSLSPNDLVSLLSARPNFGVSYIITLGYQSTEEMQKYIEICTKLEGRIFFLRPTPGIVQSIAKEIDKRFPFSGEEWMDLFPPRRMTMFIGEINEVSLGHDLSDVYFIYYYNFYHLLLKKLGLEEKDVTLSAGRFLDSTSRHNAQRKLDSFHKSIDWKEFWLHFGGNKGSSNWQSVAVSEVFNRTGSYSWIPVVNLQ